MAVFPDRIVLKNSSDSNEDIRAAIEEGGPESITLGELVISTSPTNPAIYIKDNAGNIQTVAGGGGSGGGGTQIIIKGEAPTTADDGTPLLEGDVWFNPLDGYLYIYGPLEKGFLYYNVPFEAMKSGPWGLATADTSVIPPSFPYTDSLLINDRADNDLIFRELFPGYNTNNPTAVWASIDEGDTWEPGFLKKGFYSTSFEGNRYGDIIPSGVIESYNWAGAATWRFVFSDPDPLRWVRVEAEQLVSSVNDKRGYVSLGITDMDDYIGKKYEINNSAPFFPLNSQDPNGFQIGFDGYLDAQSTTTPTPLPIENQWTMYQTLGSDKVRLYTGNDPAQQLPGYEDWATSVPNYDPTLQYYVQLTITGDYPDIDGTLESASQQLKPMPIDFYAKTPDGMVIEWDIKQLNPLDISRWGFSVNNPDRAAVEQLIYCTIILSPSFNSSNNVDDGDTLIYDAETEKWNAATPPVEVIDDLLDVKRAADGTLGVIYKYSGVGEADFFSVTSGADTSNGICSTEWPSERRYLILNYKDESGQRIYQDPVYTEKSYAVSGTTQYIWISINQGVTWRAYSWKLEDRFFQSPFSVQLDMYPSLTTIDETVEHIWLTLLDPLKGAAYKQGDALLWDTTANAFVPQVIDIEPPPQSLNDLTDVNTANPPPTANQALVYDAVTQLWQPLTLAPPGSGGALIAQAVLEEQTTDVDGNALFQGLGFWGNLIQVQSDVNAWVTLYTTAASRTADLTRSFGTFAAPGSGTIAGFNLTAGIAFQATPSVPYFNGDVIKTGAIYALARDQSGTVIPDAVITINAYGAVRFTVISGGTFSGT